MKIVIPGRPVAKRRPRFARRGKFVTTYNDQETEEGKVLLEIRQQLKGERWKGPALVLIWFGMYIPKNTSLKKRRMMLSGEIKHTKKPDIDNMIKFYLDVMNMEVFNDDSCVYQLTAIKEYTDEPKTEIWITG